MLLISAPFSKRIDGYDNVEIPLAITISPAIETAGFEFSLKEKIANYLIGLGFSEILTNSITNSNYYPEKILQSSVRLLNNLSVELDIMRPDLLQTGLECVAHNLNHKNNDLLLFEFGKAYSSTVTGNYKEEEHLCLYAAGNKNQISWREKEIKSDIYFIKGICEKLFHLSGINYIKFSAENNSVSAKFNDEVIAVISKVDKNNLDKFSIKQDVFVADIYWEKLTRLAKNVKISFKEISKYPEVKRDISMIVNKNIPYEKIEGITNGVGLSKLTNMQLFDIFESEKLGTDKRSLAISFTFSDKEKTLTDKEIDGMMNKIISLYEKDLQAEIRKS